MACDFRTSHEHLDLPVGVPLVAYRAVQEALTNVSKHAQAGRVSIDLSLARGVLSVEVSDDGRGLSSDDLAKARSFGLRGLRERAETVGGWVDVSSSERGTSIILSVPVSGNIKLGSDSQFDADSVESRFGEDARHNPSAWGDLE
jgi:signal transduction histidine kinase